MSGPVLNNVKGDEVSALKSQELQAEILKRTKLADLEQEESKLRRKLMFFGNDLGQIPCFRNSFLYGIISGFGSGIAYFALTSNIPRATSCAVYSYVAVTACYWFHCNWQISKTKFEYEQIKYAMQMHAMYDGTEKGMKRDKSNQHIDVDNSRVKF